MIVFDRYNSVFARPAGGDALFVAGSAGAPPANSLRGGSARAARIRLPTASRSCSSGPSPAPASSLPARASTRSMWTAPACGALQTSAPATTSLPDPSHPTAPRSSSPPTTAARRTPGGGTFADIFTMHIDGTNLNPPTARTAQPRRLAHLGQPSVTTQLPTGVALERIVETTAEMEAAGIEPASADAPTERLQA